VVNLGLAIRLSPLWVILGSFAVAVLLILARHRSFTFADPQTKAPDEA